MATTDAVLTALADLRADLDSGEWVPDEYERALAVGAQAEGQLNADAVRAGLRWAGPDAADRRLAPVVANCGAVLDGLGLASADDRRAVTAALDELLGLVALVGLH
jgi:hypothetical protein